MTNSNSSKYSQIFYKDSVTLVSKPNKDAIREENYRQLSLMTINVKILNKILANLIGSTLKGSYTMIKWIYPRVTRMVQYLKISWCDSLH